MVDSGRDEGIRTAIDGFPRDRFQECGRVLPARWRILFGDRLMGVNGGYHIARGCRTALGAADACHDSGFVDSVDSVSVGERRLLRRDGPHRAAEEIDDGTWGRTRIGAGECASD